MHIDSRSLAPGKPGMLTNGMKIRSIYGANVDLDIGLDVILDLDAAVTVVI